MRRQMHAEIDKRLESCGLIPMTAVQDEAIDRPATEATEEHPIDNEEIVEERFNVHRVSEEEEIRRYFAPYARNK